MSESESNENNINSQYDDLRNVINDAARVKTDINATCKESMKELKSDFSEFMLDNMEEDFKIIAERLGLFNGFADVDDKKKRAKKETSALRSFFGKMFSKAKEFEYLKKGGKPKESTPPKSDSYALDIISNLYASRLIPEVQKALDVAGIEIKFNKPITKLDFSNNDDRNAVFDYIRKGADVQNEIFEKNAEIEDVIFENIPDNMKYDKDSNPKGIKKSQFGALADLQAKTDELSMNGDAEKATDMVEKQCDKHHENSKNQEMMAIVTELILVSQNENSSKSQDGNNDVSEEQEDNPKNEEVVEEEKGKGKLEELVSKDMDD